MNKYIYIYMMFILFNLFTNNALLDATNNYILCLVFNECWQNVGLAAQYGLAFSSVWQQLAIFPIHCIPKFDRWSWDILEILMCYFPRQYYNSKQWKNCPRHFQIFTIRSMKSFKTSCQLQVVRYTPPAFIYL